MGDSPGRMTMALFIRNILAILAIALALPALAQEEKVRAALKKVLPDAPIDSVRKTTYGGLYDERSPLSDANGYRKDVMDAVRNLGVSILRWPGGNFASGYHWMDGIGPKDQRPVRAELAWNDLEPNRFGTDEFLRYCELIKTDPT